MSSSAVIKTQIGNPGATGSPGPAPSGLGNLIIATPNGSPGIASLRALVIADLPFIPINKSGDTGIGALTISDTTASVSPLTGALIVAGGIGSNGTINAISFSGAGTGLTGTAASLSIGGNAATATILQTARTINGVSFNGSANITLTANTTNALTFNNAGTGAASGTSFNGSSAITISYNSIGAPSTTGTNATGTWGISITGSASNVSAASNTTNASYYPVFATSQGTSVTLGTDPTFTFNPSTNTLSVGGSLTATVFTGAGTGLTGTAASLSIGGNASTATTLQTARTINGVSFNGSANITITANTTNALTIGNGLSGTSFNGSSAITIAVSAPNNITNASYYPIFSTTQGTAVVLGTDSTFLFNPYTGALSATSFNLITGLASSTPLMDGVATIGTSTLVARQDHIHPSDTSKVNTSLLGVANGVATLDSSGKLTSSQIPSSLIGAVVYQGVWNASTNTPTLVSGTGTKGWYYKVSVAGSTTIDGISQWLVGDTIIFDGTVWDKLDGQAVEVISVFGRSGAITAQTGDYTVTQITGAAPLASPAFTGSPTAPTPTTGDNSTLLATTAFVQNSIGNGTLTLAVSGIGLTGSASFTANQSGVSTFTVTSNATSVNTASTIVSRDASGNFSAGTITATLSGNASTATTLQTARTINGVSFDGSTNITVTANTTNALTFGTGLSGTLSSFNGSSAVTVSLATVTQSSGSNFVKLTIDSYGRISGNTAVSGTDLNTTFGSQIANTFYAAPNGSSGTPAFRAIVAADIPSLPTITTTNGNISSVTLTTTTTTANQLLDSNAITTARTVKYIVSITSGTTYQCEEILVIQDGTNTFITEYGVITTGSSLATFSAAISSGNLQLLTTPINASTTYKVMKFIINV